MTIPFQRNPLKSDHLGIRNFKIHLICNYETFINVVTFIMKNFHAIKVLTTPGCSYYCETLCMKKKPEKETKDLEN